MYRWTLPLRKLISKSRVLKLKLGSGLSAPAPAFSRGSEFARLPQSTSTLGRRALCHTPASQGTPCPWPLTSWEPEFVHFPLASSRNSWELYLSFYLLSIHASFSPTSPVLRSNIPFGHSCCKPWHYLIKGHELWQVTVPWPTSSSLSVNWKIISPVLMMWQSCIENYMR